MTVQVMAVSTLRQHMLWFGKSCQTAYVMVECVLTVCLVTAHFVHVYIATILIMSAHFKHTYKLTCMYVCLFTCLHVYLYICICKYTHKNINIHIYIHTFMLFIWKTCVFCTLSSSHWHAQSWRAHIRWNHNCNYCLYVHECTKVYWKPSWFVIL